MADLRPFEQIDAGGVDSRSNPINMPRNRALRCLNWVPKQAGYWQLRHGYATVTMSTVSASAITGLFPYRNWAGTRYVLFVQGTTLKSLDTSTGTVASPSVRGTAIGSSAKGAGFFANNRFHYGNGTDQKWFDGTTLRDSGLRSLTLAEVQNVVIVEGVRELTSTESSTITLTTGTTGTFGTATNGGYLIYVAMFDTSVNEIGPATQFVGSGRVVTGANNKITVANMLTPANANWVKLIGGTIDGGNLAWFFTNTSTSLTSCTRSGTTLTVVATSHGMSSGDVAIISGTTNFDGVYKVTVSDANTFTVTLPSTNTNANTGVVGTVKRIVKAANATASVDVTAPTQDTSYQVNQDRGLAASTVGGSQPGYQFYASIYNPNGGGHVGNRISIGGRFLQTSYRVNARISGLPDLSGTDSEWNILIGRTGDGAEVPYAVSDNSANWLYAISAQTSITVVDPTIDGASELPTRNDIIPSQCNMFAVTSSYCYAGDTGSPYLRRSGSLADANAGTFVGVPEQAWAADDIITFPTGESLRGIFEVDDEVFCGTLNDCALSVNLAGIEQWVGPFNIGLAGRRAATKCGSHGFFWVSGDKQLCTLVQGVPIAVSDEYQLAELSQIGDAYLSTVECGYYRNAALDKDELRIEFQLADGTPYTVIHDFKLREASTPPGSIYGQGYASQFVGPLATLFTIGQVRDSSGGVQLYAGDSVGQLYKLYSGDNDAGTEYPSDMIMLVNGGPGRPSVPFIDWYGDSQINISVGKTLSTSLSTSAQFGFDSITPSSDPAQLVQGAENDFLYRAYFKNPEIKHAYVRFQLTSHSSDGTLALNSPPHVPLENYGRLYELIPSMGDERAI